MKISVIIYTPFDPGIETVMDITGCYDDSGVQREYYCEDTYLKYDTEMMKSKNVGCLYRTECILSEVSVYLLDDGDDDESVIKPGEWERHKAFLQKITSMYIAIQTDREIDCKDCAAQIYFVDEDDNGPEADVVTIPVKPEIEFIRDESDPEDDHYQLYSLIPTGKPVGFPAKYL